MNTGRRLVFVWTFVAGIFGAVGCGGSDGADGNGVFADSGQALGSSYSSSVGLGDLDGDGDLDAFVANSGTEPNRVWLNDGSGVFTDSGQTLGSSNSQYVSLGDLDVFVANYTQPNRVDLNHQRTPSTS